MPERIIIDWVLADILETLRFRSSIFFRSRLAAPWGMKLGEEQAPRFHVALDGDFFVGSSGQPAPIEVKRGEIVILPGGQSHWIADRPGRELVGSEQASEACALGSPLFRSGEPTNNVLCGVARFDDRLAHPLLEALPSVIHLPRIEPKSNLWNLVCLINSEAEAGSQLATPVLNRLAEVLFLKLLGKVVIQGDADVGLVRAMTDRSTRRALELLHKNPARPWTIDELAAEVALSRASLVRRFRDSIGLPPMDYLRRWRLMKAYQSTLDTADSIEQIASRVGFASANGLVKAFQRQYGSTPAALRRAKVEASRSEQ